MCKAGMLMAAMLYCLNVVAAEAPVSDLQANLRQQLFAPMPGEDDPASRESQAFAQAASMAGREDVGVMPMATGRLPPVCEGLPDDPIEMIAREARGTSIVIINESHYSPRDRHFIGKVITALRPLGFDTYAAETFSDQVNLDHAGVLGTDGWYSNEPIYARTLLLAKQLGYHFVPYEQTPAQRQVATTGSQPEDMTSGINRREAAQTENLMARIFRANPRARVVIHVGYDHARERHAPDRLAGQQWMAERLKAATGIDPLTISQTMCDASGGGTVIARYRKAAGTRMDGSPVDLYVGHPPLTLQDGRPAWRQAIGDVRVAVPQAFLGRQERVVIEARPSMASPAEVPTDRLLLFPGDTLPLLLPRGRYRVEGFVAAGRIEAGPLEIEVR